MPTFRLIKTPRRRKYPALIQAVTRPRGGGGGAIDALAGLMNSVTPHSQVVIQARCYVRVCVFACVRAWARE